MGAFVAWAEQHTGEVERTAAYFEGPFPAYWAASLTGAPYLEGARVAGTVDLQGAYNSALAEEDQVVETAPSNTPINQDSNAEFFTQKLRKPGHQPQQLNSGSWSATCIGGTPP